MLHKRYVRGVKRGVLADITVLIPLILLVAHLGVKPVEFLLSSLFEVDVLSGFVLEHVFYGEFQIDARLKAADVTLVKCSFLVITHASVEH